VLEDVLDRANEVLTELETRHVPAKGRGDAMRRRGDGVLRGRRERQDQPTLFAEIDRGE
ncbi:MAG: hypothetical protein JO112_21650, partial [Planctomycetes bacterium]|nr:hypothetical protein [Planctomycetota bacterium]